MTISIKMVVGTKYFLIFFNKKAGSYNIPNNMPYNYINHLDVEFDMVRPISHWRKEKLKKILGLAEFYMQHFDSH